MAWPPPTAKQSHTPPPFRWGADLRGPLSVRATVAAILLCGLAGRPQAPTAKPAAEYAGSGTCAACHEEVAKAFRKNPHQRVGTGREWKGRACESCHGPGAKHAESASAPDILNPAKASPTRSEKVCLSCHSGQLAQLGRIHGGHGRNQIACSACHTIHGRPEQLKLNNAAVVNRQCRSCHTAEWAEFLRPHTHRLIQGAMACTDCHNPHGSSRPRSAQTVSGNEPGCFRCHGDKRGPFPFEHAPVRLEGCGACHEPHGSVNPRMLVRAEVRFLCLECHSNVGSRPALGGIPPAFHDLRSARYRNCTICHSRIHGSFVSRGLTR